MTVVGERLQRGSRVDVATPFGPVHVSAGHDDDDDVAVAAAWQWRWSDLTQSAHPVAVRTDACAAIAPSHPEADGCAGDARLVWSNMTFSNATVCSVMRLHREANGSFGLAGLLNFSWLDGSSLSFTWPCTAGAERTCSKAGVLPVCPDAGRREGLPCFSCGYDEVTVTLDDGRRTPSLADLQRGWIEKERFAWAQVLLLACQL